MLIIGLCIGLVIGVIIGEIKTIIFITKIVDLTVIRFLINRGATNDKIEISGN